MKRILLMFCMFLLVIHHVQAQSGRYTLRGNVVDSSGVGLPETTVMLLLPKDSSLVNFGRTNKQGEFEFKNIKRIPYLLKMSYVGYMPFERKIEVTEGETNELGALKMKLMDQDLYEVVVKAFRAPLTIRGDTVEYDPKAFKVPPGANVEDLIRRLPGMEVDRDGNIKAHGEGIKRVTVDGKRFFGDDVRAATKNLPAEAINKVQVFNEKSEQSRITGVEDGKHDKTLNLELKDSHKKGGFGKATLSAGTDNRIEGKVNYNRFNDKHQLSVLGLGSNTNSGGMNWDDYQDFKGSQSYNWGDDGDFGFGGGMRYINFGDNNDESLTIQAGRGGQNRGYNKNWAGGLNYNYDTKKTKFNTSYYFNKANQELDGFATRRNFLNNNESYTTLNTNERDNQNKNHRAGIRFEKEIDSTNTLIVLSNMRIGNGTAAYTSNQEYYRNEDGLSNRTNQQNFSDFNSFALGNTAIFRHKFKKKGRNFAASLGYNVNNSDGFLNQQSLNRFYNTPEGGKDSVLAIHQNHFTKSLRNQIKSSLLFVDPLSKKFFMESFYNFSFKTDDVTREVFDIREDGEIRNENLSRYYNNHSLFNRVGTSVRYSFKGLNISMGGAMQQIQLKGKFNKDDDTGVIHPKLDRKFTNFIPSASMNYDLKQNRYLGVYYNRNINEPNVSDLQPFVDNSNPLYIWEGNPALKPSGSHSVNMNYNMFNSTTFVQMYFGMNYQYYTDQIVYNQTVDQNLVVRTKPINMSGGNSVGAYGHYGFPIVKTKSNLSVNFNYNLSNNLTPINNVLNETQTNSYSFGLRSDLTPSDKFTLYLNGGLDWANTDYSINKAQNQKILNGSYGAELNIKLPAELYFNSRYSLNTYKNDGAGFDQTQSVLNLSIYKTMLKSKKGEIRLSAYDVFNQNKGISQYAYGNFYTQEYVRTLARYFMLSFSYNMRGMSHSVRRK